MRISDDVLATHAAVPETPDAKQTLAYRRSLRASRTRRAAAALRRRRVFRGRGSAFVARPACCSPAAAPSPRSRAASARA